MSTLALLMAAAGITSSPSSSYDPYFEQVLLLMHMDGANGGTVFTDSSNATRALTAVGATTSTAQFKYGAASCSIANSNSYVTMATMPVLGTGDFTIEGWFKPTTLAVMAWLITPNYANSAGWEIYNDATGHLYLQANATTTSASVGVVTAGVWNHVVLQRKAGVVYWYINGVLDSSTAALTSDITDTTFLVGYSSSSFVGYIDDVRVTKGIARYTTTFTPPAAAFPDSSGATGVARYATWNPSDKAGTVTLSNGNLTATISTTGSTRATLGKSSGKWYWEVTCTSVPQTLVGIANSSATLTVYAGSDAHAWTYYSVDGHKYNNGVTPAYGATYTTGDVIGIALDMDAGTVTMYKNGASQGQMYSGITGTIYPIVGTSGSAGTTTTNFGATPFKYTIPTGYNPGIF